MNIFGQLNTSKAWRRHLYVLLESWIFPPCVNQKRIGWCFCHFLIMLMVNQHGRISDKKRLCVAISWHNRFGSFSSGHFKTLSLLFPNQTLSELQTWSWNEKEIADMPFQWTFPVIIRLSDTTTTTIIAVKNTVMCFFYRCNLFINTISG